MPWFRLFLERVWQTEVEANDEAEAIEIGQSMSDHEWADQNDEGEVTAEQLDESEVAGLGLQSDEEELLATMEIK
jgi:hypothetical protein